jgi:hypothetical protein
MELIVPVKVKANLILFFQKRSTYQLRMKANKHKN